MDVVYQLQGVEFEWDQDKARSNVKKHGVTFEEAAEVFFDPLYSIGDASVAEEYREYIIGYNFASNLLITIYTERGNRTRIISARATTRAERRLYEQG
ncbi:MAG: BrnT family toxin [Acidobacteria bacterium]|nr:BrnT family toxin [Acidobacteriota bacterium]